MVKKLSFCSSRIKFKRGQTIVESNGMAFPVLDDKNTPEGERRIVIEVHNDEKKVEVVPYSEYQKSVLQESQDSSFDVQTDPEADRTKDPDAQRSLPEVFEVGETEIAIVYAPPDIIEHVRVRLEGVLAHEDPNGKHVVVERLFVGIHEETQQEKMLVRVKALEMIERSEKFAKPVNSETKPIRGNR